MELSLTTLHVRCCHFAAQIECFRMFGKLEKTYFPKHPETSKMVWRLRNDGTEREELSGTIPCQLKNATRGKPSFRTPCRVATALFSRRKWMDGQVLLMLASGFVEKYLEFTNLQAF